MHGRLVDALGFLAGDEVRDVVGREDRGLLGVLDHLGDRVFFALGDIVHVVADDEDVRVGGLQGLEVDDAVVARIEGLGRFAGDGLGRDAGAPDDRAGRDRDDLADLLIDEGVRFDFDDFRVHLEVDAELFQDAGAGRGDLVRQVRDGAGSRVDAEDSRKALGQFVLDAHHRDVLGEFAGQLDTGETGADHTEREELFLLFFVREGRGFLEAFLDVFLQSHGVVIGPEGEGVLLSALDAEEVRSGTGRDDQIVVGVVIDIALDDFVFEIDVSDFILEEADVGGVREGLREIVRDAFGFSPTRGSRVDLRSHREIRIFVDKRDADVLETRSLLFETLRTENTGKTGTDDDDVFLFETLSHCVSSQMPNCL